MNVTVILCTYNRCQSLAKALESVAVSTLPRCIEWEVLVVDNNSRDETREVVENFCRRYPGRFRYLFESRQGKSHALNSGIREARGDVLAFTDDDATVEPAWLHNLTASLIKGECAGVGGRTIPAQALSLPNWLSIEEPFQWGGIVGAFFDLGDKPCELSLAPYGVNMAVRKEVLEKHGNFRTDMGPCPGSEIRNEDTEFGRRLLAAGERLRYEPSAIVHHAVPENRLEKTYFLAFWFDQGRASVREWKDGPDILGVPRECFWILKLGARLPWRALRWILTLNPQRRFFRKCVVWMTIGVIVEIYRRLVSSMDPKQGAV